MRQRPGDDGTMAAPSMKALARSRELKLGHFIVEFATPGIGQILKGAGCDFALFDCEHSGFGFETIKSTLRYMQAADLPTIVRVPSRSYDHIARAADMGAEGIMLPMVGSVEEARQILDCVKYVPDGRRGVALAIAHDRYLPGPTLEKLAAANARTTVFAQIETREGVDNADALAATDGIDCLWIGHFDLSSSLGIPGQFEHQDFQDAVATVTKACQKHDKALGRLVPSAEEGVRLAGQGFDFICYSGDAWALQAAVQAGVTAIREGAAADAAVRAPTATQAPAATRTRAGTASKAKSKAKRAPKGKKK